MLGRKKNPDYVKDYGDEDEDDDGDGSGKDDD